MWHRGMTVQESETVGRALAWETGSWVVRCFSYLRLGFGQEASLQGSGDRPFWLEKRGMVLVKQFPVCG